MKMTEKSCADFVAVLATKAPVPGGGGASALCGAIGTALGNMVGSLTVGKKKYAAVEEEIKSLQAKCDALQADLLALADLRPQGTEMVFTGRGATDNLIARADLCTEMHLVKHYYQEKKLPARVGIEM